jgi:hypothetical protein
VKLLIKQVISAFEININPEGHKESKGKQYLSMMMLYVSLKDY